MRDNDYATINVSLYKKDPLGDVKEDLLDRYGDPEDLHIPENIGNYKFEKALSFLRYLLYDGTVEFLKEIKAKFMATAPTKQGVKKFRARSFPAISIKTEKRVFEKIKILCEKRLHGYKTSALDDSIRLSIFYREIARGKTELQRQKLHILSLQ